MMSTLVVVLVLSAAGGQQHDHASMASGRGQGTAALTAAQVEQLLAGEGMGLAAPAELNRYPGPKHLLELAAELELSPAQRTAFESIRAEMLARATPLGARIVEAERALDAAFASGAMTEARVRESTAAIAVLYGELRSLHLVAHVRARTHLRPDQIAAYERLRGYDKR